MQLSQNIIYIAQHTLYNCRNIQSHIPPSMPNTTVMAYKHIYHATYITKYYYVACLTTFCSPKYVGCLIRGMTE